MFLPDLKRFVFQGLFCFQSHVTKPTGVSEDDEKDSAPKPLRLHPGPLVIGSCSGFMETTVKIKQNDMLPGPKVCCFRQDFYVTLSIQSSIRIQCIFIKFIDMKLSTFGLLAVRSVCALKKKIVLIHRRV